MDTLPLRFRGARGMTPCAMLIKPIAVAAPRATLELSIVQFIQPELDHQLRGGHYP